MFVAAIRRMRDATVPGPSAQLKSRVLRVHFSYVLILRSQRIMERLPAREMYPAANKNS
jgi:hypothetical protein